MLRAPQAAPRPVPASPGLLDRVSSRVLSAMRVVVPVGQFTREECGDRQVLSPGGVLVVASPWLPVPPFCFELTATPHWEGVLKSRCIKIWVLLTWLFSGLTPPNPIHRGRYPQM